MTLPSSRNAGVLLLPLLAAGVFLAPEPAAAQDAVRAFGQPGVNWFMALVCGAIAGWLAEKLTSSNMGLIANIVMGVLGALLGNWLAGFFGIGVYGFLANLLSATIGAVIIITAYRAIRGRSTSY